MSTPDSQMSLDQQIEQIQNDLDNLHTNLTQVREALLYYPQKAYDALTVLQSRADSIYQDFENWARRREAATSQQGIQADVQWRRIDDNVFIGLGQGHCMLVMGKLREAQKLFQQTLNLLGDQPHHSRPGLLGYLGVACYQQGLLSEAESYYRRAYDDDVAMADNYLRYAQSIQGQTTQENEERAGAESLAHNLWRDATQNLSGLALCALMQGRRADYTRFTTRAKEIAQEHGLQAVHRKLEMDELKLRLLNDAAGTFTDEMTKLVDLDDMDELHEDVSIQIEVKLFAAEQAIARGSVLDLAKIALQQAEQLAQTNNRPDYQWSVRLLRLQLDAKQLPLDEAIQHAEAVVRQAEEEDVQTYKQQALNTLIDLRFQSPHSEQRAEAERDIEKLSMLGLSTVLAQVLVTRASLLAREGRAADALQDIQRAEACGIQGYQRLETLFAKVAVLKAAGHKQEAFELGMDVIQRYHEQLLAPNGAIQVEWRDVLSRLESLYTGMALLIIDLEGPEHLNKAFELAEQGKSQILRHELAQSGKLTGVTPEPITSMSFSELRTLLAYENAALALFGISETRSWVFIVDPQQEQPRYMPIDLTTHQLRELIPTGMERNALFAALPVLSKRLCPALQDIVNRYPMLYLVPSSQLSSVPFAALTLDDGKPLIEHCALAWTPTASMIQWYQSRTQPHAQHTCLALGTGSAAAEDGSQIAFAKQAGEIANLPWSVHTAPLSEATTPDELLQKAQDSDVLHIACHGTVNNGMADGLLASFIELDKKSYLTAKRVFELDGQLHAELVFLNACLSAQYNQQMRSEVSGFWQAFFHAGATSLIATLIKVDPRTAHQLALNFYTHWLAGGITKAEALRQAQLDLYKQGLEAYHWASHILVGDHR